MPIRVQPAPRKRHGLLGCYWRYVLRKICDIIPSQCTRVDSSALEFLEQQRRDNMVVSYVGSASGTGDPDSLTQSRASVRSLRQRENADVESVVQVCHVQAIRQRSGEPTEKGPAPRALII